MNQSLPQNESSARSRMACSSEAGINRLGVLVFGLVIASAVFVGYHVFPFYYDYWEIQGLMQAQADKASIFQDAEIRKNILERIKKLEIPVEDPEKLKINRYDGKILIEMDYDEVLFIDLGMFTKSGEENIKDLHVFHFHPYAEARIPDRG